MGMTGRRARSHVTLGVVVVVAAALAGAAFAAFAAQGATRAKRVNVTEKEYKITLAHHSMKPGMVKFTVRNVGAIGHEFEIRGPGIKGKRIAGMINPGATRSLTVRLRRGTYTLWCPIHGAQGMKTTIKVGAATISGGGNTTTTGGGGASWG
jgi:plastocyanin